ncbi:Chromate transporter [compost metagenome]
MTLLVQPVIAIMMAVLTWQMAKSPADSIGIWQTLIIAAVAFLAIQRFKIHPALVIIAAFIYGGFVLQYTV